MTSDSTLHFYRDLAALQHFQEVADLASYQAVPGDWQVLVTDVRGSTKAIEAGRYKDVNALGVGCIVAALNAVAGRTEFPFVFGGDGATFVLPPREAGAVRQAMAAMRTLGREQFGLELRVGLVPVADIEARGQRVLVARYAASSHVHLAMFSGGGLALADSLVKSAEHGPGYGVHEDGPVGDASLDGFECRWKPLQSRRGEVLTLLVMAMCKGAQPMEDNHGVYARVLAHIDEACRAETSPVQLENLQIAPSMDAFRAEARLRAGRLPGWLTALYRFKAFVTAQIGRFAMAARIKVGPFDGRTYREEVLRNTDFRKFDDLLRMVLDVTPEAREAIVAWLDAERARGTLVYGTHLSGAAQMTCMIRNYSGEHVHFVDGTDGGYALAAKELKAQLRAHEEAEAQRVSA